MAASTRDLSPLPSIEALRRQMQSLALLDAILESEWQYRYFSFNAKWSQTEQMGSMRNGSGDDLFAIFDDNGCFLRGFDHESVMSPWNSRHKKVWPGVLDRVPPQMSTSLREPAFHMEDTTFCIWRLRDDANWSVGAVDFPDGNDPDGSEWMLSLVAGTALDYQTFATDYFELDVHLEPVKEVFAHAPLSQHLLAQFPTKRDWKGLVADAHEIGYRVAT
jgi:hypothetical protein